VLKYVNKNKVFKKLHGLLTDSNWWNNQMQSVIWPTLGIPHQWRRVCKHE